MSGENLTRIITVASGKGGVGKTTLVSNLGVALVRKFNRYTTVIDCNVTTSHLGLYLGMYYTPATLNKVLRGEVSIEEAIYEHFSGMKILPASLSLSDLEGVDLTQIRDKIKTLFESNDIILLDSSPGLGREAVAALKASDEVLLVTTPFVPPVMDIVRCLEVIKEIGVKPIGIVLNMVHKKKYEMTETEVEQLTGIPVIASISYDKNVPKSLAAKVPVVISNPRSNVSRDVFKLAAKLVGETYEPESTFRRIINKIKGKFSRRVEIVVPPKI